MSEPETPRYKRQQPTKDSLDIKAQAVKDSKHFVEVYREKFQQYMAEKMWRMQISKQIESMVMLKNTK